VSAVSEWQSGLGRDRTCVATSRLNPDNDRQARANSPKPGKLV